jgi:hypothetical protein
VILQACHTRAKVTRTPSTRSCNGGIVIFAGFDIAWGCGTSGRAWR